MFNLSNLTVSNPTMIGISTSNSTVSNITVIVFLVWLLLVIALVMVVLIRLEGVTHISNLDFLLLRDPTVLPYPLSYSELESLESLSLW